MPCFSVYVHCLNRQPVSELPCQVFSNRWPGDALSDTYYYKRAINGAHPVDSKIMLFLKEKGSERDEFAGLCVFFSRR
ncbi:MAG: hypothetical protein HW419_2301 [Deltaproteobacteria bacterium]|nr:hypothetical protein [Deltaproteobacteria bacterium]